MRLLSPQSASFLNRQLFNEYPSARWLQLTASEKDFLDLLGIVNGTPRTWLEWVEGKIDRNQRHGIQIRNPLAYRLATLWNGIICLQEAKYLCDLLETTLRQAFASYAVVTQIPLSAIAPTVPSWKSACASFKAARGKVPDLQLSPNIELMECFSFYQLTDTIFRNWRTVGNPPLSWLGFGSMFWHERPCRDPNLFQAHAKLIRDVRNDIAHTRRLLEPHETERVYKLAKRWLLPLGIHVHERVLAYRRARPRFLEGIRF